MLRSDLKSILKSILKKKLILKQLTMRKGDKRTPVEEKKIARDLG